MTAATVKPTPLHRAADARRAHDLGRAVRRVPLDGHDGRSGATLERVALDDGTQLIVKTAEPGVDLAGVASGDSRREEALWSSGVLDRLPHGVGHAVVRAWTANDGTVVTIMRDLGPAVVGWRATTRSQCRRILAAAASVHHTFAGHADPRCCPLERRLTLLGPESAASLGRPDGNDLPALIRRGWELFAEITPADVVTAVFAVFEQPAALAHALRQGGTTMLHGDLTLANVALCSDEVVLLDWGLATDGPPAIDLAILLAGCASRIHASREAVIEDFRHASGDQHDETTLRVALLVGLLELGWNKATDIIDNPAIAERERADLDWWVTRARIALDTAGL